MAAVCPGCGKFASLEETDPEIDEGSEDITDNDDGSFSFTVPIRLVRTSACCGEEMKEAQLELEFTGEHECTITKKPEYKYERYEVESYSAEPTDRYQTIDRNGNLIKRSRYQKHYIGADATASVVCLWCNQSIDVHASVEEQASGFDEV